jgi:hypothetical protein
LWGWTRRVGLTLGAFGCSDHVPDEHALLLQLPDGTSTTSELIVEVVSEARSWAYRMTLRSSHGAWTAEGPDVFTGLMELRRRVDALGMLICCNGARLDSWASGMQRDMGNGSVCYLLEGVEPGTRPPSVRTLDPAPCDRIATVADQEAWHAAWLSRRS